MLKLPYEDFKEEIEAEMYGYEEINESLIERWMENLDAYVAKKPKNDKLSYKNKEIEIHLKDESDLFMIVDKYLAAVVNEEIEAYYEQWQL